MKNFKILSGLSLAAVLALIPAQSLSNSIATPELGHATNQNYSGGFNKNTSGKGGTTSSGNSVEMRGDPNGKDYSNSIIYGGGIGDGTKDGSVYRFEQTEAAKDNKLTIKDGASAWIAIGGEGKGAQRNTLNVENATVDTVVGGNGTWYGLADHSGDAIDNTVNIKQGSTIKGTFNGFNASQEHYVAIGGRATGTSASKGNSVNISGGNIASASTASKNYIAGGFGQEGEVGNNSVNITGGTFKNSHIIGGRANLGGNGALTNNTVTIDSANSVLKDVIGGWGGNVAKGNKVFFKNGIADNLYGTYNAKDAGGDGEGNEVTISGGSVNKNVYGSYNDRAGGKVANGKVNMSAGTVRGDIYGGYNLTGSVDKGSVTLTGGSVGGNVYGGYAKNDATQNKVTSENTTIGGSVGGGHSKDGAANSNIVNLQGGSVGGKVYGGRGKTGASSNSVTAKNLNISQSVTGGDSSNGAANSNTVNFEGGSVNGNIMGGNGGSGASNNVVSTKNTTVVNGDVRGGTSLSGDANSNTAKLQGGNVGGNVYGGYSTGGEASGNNVTTDGTTVQRGLFGGYAGGSKSSKNNTVTASNTTVRGDAVGGTSQGGAVEGNKISLNGGSVGGDLKGGLVSVGNANAKGNTAEASGTTITKNAYGGQAFGTGHALNNTLKLTGGSVGGNAYGGQSADGDSVSNTLTSNNTEFGGDVVGGASSNSDALSNIANLSGGKVNGYVYGGKGGKNATTNKVTLNNVTAKGVIGGYASGGDANGNNVTVNGGKVTQDVIGGLGDGREASGNTVTLDGGAKVGGSVYGGKGIKGKGNTVNFKNASVAGKIYGIDNANAYNSDNTLNVYNASTKKTAKDIVNFNTLNFNGLSEANSKNNPALGLSADDKTDINNATFKINNTAYDPNVDNYGNFNVQEGKEYYLVHNEKGFKNFTEKAKQTGNVFTIKNATTYETSIKGLIKSYDEKDILIQGSKNVDRKIKNDDGSGFDNEELTRYGGSANGNTVNIGTTAGAGVDFGGLNVNAGSNANVNFIDGKNLGNVSSAGGTLNIGKDRHNPLKPNTLSARNISGFKNINFFLPPNITNGDSMLKLTDPNAHTDLSNIGGKITAYISGNADSTPTSTVHLIKKEGNGLLKLPDASKLVARVVQGVSLRYENYYLTNNNNKSLDLNFDRLKTGAHTNVTMNPDTKSFAETRTAGLAALKSGSELITNYLDKLIPDGHLELFPFAIGEVHSLRYETGSHIDSKGYAVAAGLANLTPNSAGEILSGVFVEYGKANYDSYLDNGLHADGDSEYIGGGLMLKQNFSGGSYLDGSLHVGKISSDYNSNDWTYRALGGGVGHEEKFDISSTYFSTHLGIGHIFDLSDSNKLDIYAKWLYARTQGASATITSGEKYDFASVKSNRIRAGLRDTINLKDEHNLYFGGAYEYEFDGVGKASFKGHEAPRPSLKGSTGVFEAGYKYDSKNLILSVGGKGYIGKTKGAAINAGFEIMF